MSATTTMLFLAGTLVGALLALGTVWLGYRNRTPRHHKDPLYAAAHYAAISHCRRYGNLTPAVLRDALNLPDVTVERYLNLLEREGVIRQHGHDAKKFYTRA